MESCHFVLFPNKFLWFNYESMYLKKIIISVIYNISPSLNRLMFRGEFFLLLEKHQTNQKQTISEQANV